MKITKAFAGVLIMLILTTFLMTACGSNNDPTTASSTEAETVDTGASATAAALTGTPTAEDMEKAVHNSFSDSFSKTINESELFSMDMHAEDTDLVWELTFKKDLDDSEKVVYRETLEETDLTENLTTVRGAVQKDVSSTNFSMTVRYYTKDGELLLEQKSK